MTEYKTHSAYIDYLMGLSPEERSKHVGETVKIGNGKATFLGHPGDPYEATSIVREVPPPREPPKIDFKLDWGGR